MMLRERQRAPPGQRPGQTLLDGEKDSRDPTIRSLEAKMVELKQVLVAKNFKIPAPSWHELVKGCPR